MRNLFINASEFVTVSIPYRCYGVHKKLLSNKERQILIHFIKTGNKQEGFRMLKTRIKRNYPTIVEDFDLLKKVVDKLVET